MKKPDTERIGLKMQVTLECNCDRGFQIPPPKKNRCNPWGSNKPQVPPELKSEFRQGDGVQGMRVEDKREWTENG